MGRRQPAAHLPLSAHEFDSTKVALYTLQVNSSGEFVDAGSPATDYTEGDQDATLTGKVMLAEKPSSNEVAPLQVSTAAAAFNSLGLHVRGVVPSIQSITTLVTSTNSTHRYQILSSQAGLRHKVFAYAVGSTHPNPSSAIFQSSGLGNQAGTDLWATNFRAGSSGITGPQLAVEPPAFLFQTAADEPLTVRLEGGNSTAASTTIARISLSYFTEA